MSSALGGGYKGTLNPTNSELTGTWSQGPASVPLTLRRAVEVGLGYTAGA